ncbi:MAG: CoA transferase [Chloroflexi bacterium]|nr:CoA transferase [Chloroflexota bacterium]
MKYPLEGIRALDHGHVWAGPLLGNMLSDMGAQVIKVQAPHRFSGVAMGGVGSREAGLGNRPPSRDHPLAYHGYDRGKLSITLDLSKEAGKQLYKRLVAVSDIIIDNFSPGVWERLDLGYRVLRQANPRIIVASLAATGSTPGPWRDALTYGPSVAALYGLKSLLGYQDDPHPREDTADIDPTAASYGLVAILAALEYRDRTGKGNYIDLSHGEAALQRIAEPMMDYFFNGRVAGIQGNRYPGVAPHGIYRCTDASPEEGRETADRWVSIVVWEQEEWEALCRVLEPECPQARDPRYQDRVGRVRHQDELDRLIEQWTRRRSAEEATRLLQQAGVAACPVMGLPDLLGDPNQEALRTQVQVEVPEVTPSDIYQGIPWKLARNPGSIRGPVPTTGEHNEFVFGELLGVVPAELAYLKRDGIIG